MSIYPRTLCSVEVRESDYLQLVKHFYGKYSEWRGFRGHKLGLESHQDSLQL
jgi:hypothetical protein